MVNTSLPVYLDYMATTPVDSVVAKKMAQYLTIDGHFGNPSSKHIYGINALKAVEEARSQVAALINAKPQEIIWTSGATESDNLAIKGAARFYSRKGKHIITMKTEHKAVLDSCDELVREGFEVTYLSPQKNGLLAIQDLKAAIRQDTILVSIMYVNNEIGVIQDIQAIGELLHEKGIVFHVDAVQAAGKVLIDVAHLPVSLMSFTAHKIYGPKGIGALYVRRKPRIRLQAIIHGGGHENGLRSGTLATHQIVGMGEAFYQAKCRFEKDNTHIMRLKNQLWAGIKEIPDMYLNGCVKNRIAGNINVSFKGIDGEALLLALSPLAVSTASACTSASIEPSYVLKALGLSDELAHSAVRISIGRFTTEKEIALAINIINEQVARLRKLSPL